MTIAKQRILILFLLYYFRFGVPIVLNAKNSHLQTLHLLLIKMIFWLITIYEKIKVTSGSKKKKILIILLTDFVCLDLSDCFE